MTKFLKTHLPSLITFVIFLSIFLTSFFYLQYTEATKLSGQTILTNNNTSEIENIKKEITSEATTSLTEKKIYPVENIKNTKTDLDLVTNTKQIFNTSTQIKQAITTQKTATLEIGAQSYYLNLDKELSLYQAMDQLKQQNILKFNGINYPGLGFFINSLNGIKNNNRTGYYWIYYINNQTAKTGISNYLIRQGDIIKWQYEKDKF